MAGWWAHRKDLSYWLWGGRHRRCVVTPIAHPHGRSIGRTLLLLWVQGPPPCLNRDFLRRAISSVVPSIQGHIVESACWCAAQVAIGWFSPRNRFMMVIGIRDGGARGPVTRPDELPCPPPHYVLAFDGLEPLLDANLYMSQD